MKHFLLLSLMLFPVSLITAQGRVDPGSGKGWGIPASPLNCEMNRQNLEHVKSLFETQVSRNGLLIIIARLGNGENRRELNDRRLYNVSTSLSRLLGVPAEKIIVAEGKRVKGFGRVEFYLDGELVGALLVNKGRDICVGCCGPDERFYPYRGRFMRKGKHKNRVDY